MVGDRRITPDGRSCWSHADLLVRAPEMDLGHARLRDKFSADVGILAGHGRVGTPAHAPLAALGGEAVGDPKLHESTRSAADATPSAGATSTEAWYRAR